ncbi:TetR/AcrR family transcriptional regulator [uncultured Acetobacterium sp.]|uniref:TetR/AcrR family transcriptional regulator n=1 Tax=uncultured Acetobacterium sp. TaxID=217139 RepID=UPI0025F57125|nr:TetR/AcrR family transcriptional regulator [uncultured Acetobacterium sp.]
MSEKPYHHGNLRNSLIEAGIELINKKGEDGLSLRKVAARCGVSHSAPYSHFKNKDELLQGMQHHVTNLFMTALESAIETYSDSQDPEILIQMGKAYVLFFINQPHYFSFLFSHSSMSVNLAMDDDGTDNFPPFEILRQHSFRILKSLGMDDQTIKDSIITMWSTVHGLASIATMKNVRYDKSWETKIEDLLRNTQGDLNDERKFEKSRHVQND